MPKFEVKVTYAPEYLADIVSFTLPGTDFQYKTFVESWAEACAPLRQAYLDDAAYLYGKWEKEHAKAQ